MFLQAQQSRAVEPTRGSMGVCGAQNLRVLRKPVAHSLAWYLGWWWRGGDETGPVSPRLNMLPMFLDARFSFFQIFIYLFLAVLSLRCCTQALLSLQRVGSPLSWCVGFSLPASLVAQAPQLCCTSLAALRHVRSFQTREGIRVPHIGKIPTHCTAREVLFEYEDRVCLWSVSLGNWL